MQGMNKTAVLLTERQQSNHATCSSAVMFLTLKRAEQASAGLGNNHCSTKRTHYKLVLAIYARANSIFITGDGGQTENWEARLGHKDSYSLRKFLSGILISVLGVLGTMDHKFYSHLSFHYLVKLFTGRNSTNFKSSLFCAKIFTL